VIRASAIAAAVLLTFTAPGTLSADLAQARAERNLDRRTRLALDNGALQLRLAAEANKSGEWLKTRAALDELGESIDLAYASQKETGRNPRGARQYKNLEVRVRGLLKTLEEFQRTLDFQQREETEPLVEKIRRVHDEVLQSILAPKRKK